MASAAAAAIQHVVCGGVSLFSTPRNLHLSPSWKGMRVFSFSSFSRVRDGRERLYISSVIEKPTDNSSNGDPERVVLERLYSKSAQLGAKMEEFAGSEVMGDHSGDLEALRRKEQELKAAERLAKVDDKEVQSAKSALLQGKKELEAAHTVQRARKDEVSRLQKQLILQAKELKEVKRTLREQQRRVQSLQGQISEKQTELSRLKSSLLEKDENLFEIRKKFRVKDSQLQAANSIISQQSLEVDELKRCLKEKENEVRRSEEERFLKQEKLSRTEADLEKHVVSYLHAKEELKSLQQELVRIKDSDLASKQELKQANALLNKIRSELEDSRRNVANLRREVQEQGLQIKHQHEEMASLEVILSSQVLKLEEAMAESEKEREQVRLARSSCKALEAEVKQGRDRVMELQTDLDKEKAAVQDSAVEVNSLKCKLLQLESKLSDTQLSLQLKEAELVTAKLEIHQLRSDLNSLRSMLAEKDHDLQIIRKVVEELRLEVTQLKVCLKNEQEKYAETNALLHDKEDQLKVVKLDLNATKVKLLEAASVVQEIAEFSRILADSSKEKQSAYYESSVVMNTNYELFAANRAFLERECELQNLHQKASRDFQKQKEVEEELQAVTRCLEEKHLELEAVQKSLASKEQELKQICGKWEAREEELARMREEVMGEAKSLTNVRLLSQRRAGRLNGKGDKSSQESELALEVAKQEVETVICSLQQLVELSRELVELKPVDPFPSKTSNQHVTLAQSPTTDILQFQNKPVSDTPRNLNGEKSIGYSRVVFDKDDINRKMGESNEALENTKQAVSDLNKLTQRLVAEAATEIGWQVENGSFASTLLTQSACS